MRKVGLFSMVLMLGAGAAFAGSLVVPWFVDNAPVANKIPGIQNGVSGSIVIKSNIAIPLNCTIEYFNQNGDSLGPYGPTDNTFTIPPNASVGFRPVAFDPSPEVPLIGMTGGQESELGLAVPDRPRDVDTKKNGSCTIRWVGAGSDASGIYRQYYTSLLPNSTQRVTMAVAHLLPPGID